MLLLLILASFLAAGAFELSWSIWVSTYFPSTTLGKISCPCCHSSSPVQFKCYEPWAGSVPNINGSLGSMENGCHANHLVNIYFPLRAFSILLTFCRCKKTIRINIAIKPEPLFSSTELIKKKNKGLLKKHFFCLHIYNVSS